MSEKPTAGARTLELLEAARNYNRWTFRRVGKRLGRRTLEIGCGTGTITSFLLDRDLVVAIDVVDEYVREATSRYATYPNVRVRKQDITESVAGLRDFGFDSALSVNVFEHIADDEAAMRAVFSVLQPGGTFTILVPCHPALMSPFDRAIGHHRRYTKRQLRAKLEASGFLVEELRYSNPIGALGWLVIVRLLGSRRLRGVGLNDVLVPMLAAIEIVEPPFGLSLVAIARKPGGG